MIIIVSLHDKNYSIFIVADIQEFTRFTKNRESFFIVFAMIFIAWTMLVNVLSLLFTVFSVFFRW